MTSPPQKESALINLVGEAGKLVADQLPEKWQGRLGLMRGFFLGDARLQMQRLMAVMRHFRDYHRLERALFYHRYATNLLLAYRLGVLEIFESGPATADDVARACEIDRSTAHIILRILESQDILYRDGERFEATPFTREFLATESPATMLPMFEICEAYAHSFAEFVPSARSGEVPPLLDIFHDEGRIDPLLNGVNYYLDQAARELIARVDWPPIESFIVGSMGVSFSSLLLNRFPDSRVTYGCLPHLVERIPRLREAYSVDPTRVDGMHAHGGEPDEDRWGDESFDLVFLTKKMVLDPANDLGRKFAQKSLEVLNPGGVAVFWEAIHEDEGPTPIDRALESFLDFGVSPRAPLLTRRSFAGFLEELGFCESEVVMCLEGATTFVVARKE